MGRMPFNDTNVWNKPEYDEDEHENLRCKFCGSTDVRWRQQGGKWVLFSLTPGVLHVCPLSDDDFPDLLK